MGEYKRLTEMDLKRALGDVAFRRGMEYFHLGKVKQRSLDEGLVCARVSGAADYKVVVIIGEGGQVASTCTCSFRGRICKHAAAVLIAWIRHPESFAAEEPPAHQIDREAQWAELKAHYVMKREEIQAKLKEFEEIYHQGDEAIFLELAYCICEAGSDAQTGLRCVAAIRDVVLTAGVNDIAQWLKPIHRSAEAKAECLVQTREYLTRVYGMRIKEQMEAMPDRQILRDFFVENPGIKGVGYREASHFLRNVGFKGYAILDGHIINCLYELGVVNSLMRPVTKKKYIEIEDQMRGFSAVIGMDLDELGLLLWSMKTGEMPR